MSQSSLRTGAGAGKGLETLLAQRLLDRRQQLDEQKFTESQRQATADEGFKTRQLDENSKIRLMHEQELIDAHNESEQLKRVNIAMTRPIGSDVTPEEMNREKTAGVPSGMYDWTPGNMGMSTPEGEVGATPTRIRWQGKEADRIKDLTQMQKDQYNQDLLQEREKDRINRMEIAKLMAATRENTAGSNAVRMAKFKGPDGKDYEGLIDGSGKMLWSAASQLPAGMKDKEANYSQMLDQIDALIKTGDESQWKGIGLGIGPVKSAVMKTIGKGSDSEDILRIGVNSVKADIAHEKYGSAFTQTEKNMLKEFAPSSNMHHRAARNRLVVMRSIISNRLSELSRGVPATPLTPAMLTEKPGFLADKPLPNGSASADPMGLR